MRRKLTAFVACLAGTMLLIVPSAMAAIAVTGISPSTGSVGSTVQCAITGAFNVPLNVDVSGTTYETPGFTLDNGVDTPIPGITDPASVTATSASVSFYLPVDCPAVTYVLRASQVNRIWIIANTDTAALPNAFQVVQRPTLGTPACPKSVKKGKTIAVWGTLTPHFAAGAKTVTVKAYRQVKRKWTLTKSYAAVNTDSGAATKYSVKIKLTKPGKYRFNANTVAAAGWLAAATGYSRTLTVK